MFLGRKSSEGDLCLHCFKLGNFFLGCLDKIEDTGKLEGFQGWIHRKEGQKSLTNQASWEREAKL